MFKTIICSDVHSEPIQAVFDQKEFEKIHSVNDKPSFNMKTQYYPIQRDDDYLLSFITEIIDFLEGPKPTFDEKCGLCNLKKNNFN